LNVDREKLIARALNVEAERQVESRLRRRIASRQPLWRNLSVDTAASFELEFDRFPRRLDAR
jgi:hypothetical protein